MPTHAAGAIVAGWIRTTEDYLNRTWSMCFSFALCYSVHWGIKINDLTLSKTISMLWVCLWLLELCDHTQQEKLNAKLSFFCGLAITSGQVPYSGWRCSVSRSLSEKPRTGHTHTHFYLDTPSSPLWELCRQLLPLIGSFPMTQDMTPAGLHPLTFCCSLSLPYIPKSASLHDCLSGFWSVLPRSRAHLILSANRQ